MAVDQAVAEIWRFIDFFNMVATRYYGRNME